MPTSTVVEDAVTISEEIWALQTLEREFEREPWKVDNPAYWELCTDHFTSLVGALNGIYGDTKVATACRQRISELPYIASLWERWVDDADISFPEVRAEEPDWMVGWLVRWLYQPEVPSQPEVP